jgi:lysophospholipase L1-like esterase
MHRIIVTHKAKSLTLLICFFIFFHSFSQSIPGNPTSDIKSVQKIVMAGNSITYGGEWTKLLNRSDVTNWGIPGYTTGQIAWTIKNILAHKPSVCFLEGGINDLTLGINPKRIFQNQVAVIDTLLAHQVIPVVQSTIYQYQNKDKNSHVKKVNRMIKKYCLTHNVEYIDLNDVLSYEDELKSELTTDGTHLKKEAYLLWAKLVSDMLVKLKI